MRLRILKVSKNEYIHTTSENKATGTMFRSVPSMMMSMNSTTERGAAFHIALVHLASAGAEGKAEGEKAAFPFHGNSLLLLLCALLEAGEKVCDGRA